MSEQPVAERAEAQAPAAPAGGAMTTQDPVAMVQSAIASGYAPETLEKLMALAERYEANNARKAFYEALSAFRSEAPRIEKNERVNYSTQKGTTDYRHSTLDNVVAQVSPVLARYGLSFRWDLEQVEGGALRVGCIVSHRDGHYEVTHLQSGRDESGQKNNLQALGSAQTYLERYTLMAALGLSAAAPDDDGAGAANNPPDPGNEYITEQQAADIDALIDEIGVDRTAFLKWAKVNKVSDIKARAYPEVVRRLEERRKSNQGQ